MSFFPSHWTHWRGYLLLSKQRPSKYIEKLTVEFQRYFFFKFFLFTLTFCFLFFVFKLKGCVLIARITAGDDFLR